MLLLLAHWSVHSKNQPAWGVEGETPGFQSFGSASSELCDLGQAWSLAEPLLGRMGMMLK